MQTEITFFQTIQTLAARIVGSKIAAEKQLLKDFNESEPSNFMDVMADVLSSNLTASLTKVGLFEGWNLKDALTQQN